MCLNINICKSFGLNLNKYEYFHPFEVGSETQLQVGENIYFFNSEGGKVNFRFKATVFITPKSNEGGKVNEGDEIKKHWTNSWKS